MLESLKNRNKQIITASLNKSRNDLLKYIEEKKQTKLKWQDRISRKKIDFNVVSVNGYKIEINRQSPALRYGKITIGVTENEVGNCQFICEINPVGRLFLFQLFFAFSSWCSLRTPPFVLQLIRKSIFGFYSPGSSYY